MYIIIFILAMVTAFVAVIFGLDGLLVWMQDVPVLQSYSIGISVILLYYGLFETLGSRTLGKLITGTKVVMAENGARPTADAILKRTLSRLIPFEQFSFLGEYSKGWHDNISRTAVIDIKKYNAEVFRLTALDDIGKEEF